MGDFVQEVEYVSGVWHIAFESLIDLLAKSPEHAYQQRKNDKKGNAKTSFILDIRNPLFKKVI
jgi:hypothetical protein